MIEFHNDRIGMTQNSDLLKKLTETKIPIEPWDALDYSMYWNYRFNLDRIEINVTNDCNIKLLDTNNAAYIDGLFLFLILSFLV
jgi:hypothetical protein